MNKYTITKNNLHIVDSAFVEKERFAGVLARIKNLHPHSDVWKRSMCSLKLEWASHNALYAIGYKRDHTKDVDLNYPQPLWARVAYSVCGVIVWPFIN